VRVTYRPDGIEVEVQDTGSAAVAVGSGGHGLVGMRERAGLYGGEFEAGSLAGGGWRVRVRIPLAEVADRGESA
jgi:signal transduction histidine kinase